MTFTNETIDHLFTAPGALRGVLADACAGDADPGGTSAGGGLICPDADLDFHPDELGLFDAFDVIDEMRDALPNLKHAWRDDDGTRVTLVAETGEMLVASYTVIELGHRSGTTRDRKREQMKRLTEKNRAKAIAWLEGLHGALEMGDRESHRGDLDGHHWLDGFDDPELAYAVVRYRESGRDVLRVMWLDLTSVDDAVADLKECRVESIEAADLIGDEAVWQILTWDDENRTPADWTAA